MYYPHSVSKHRKKMKVMARDSESITAACGACRSNPGTWVLLTHSPSDGAISLAGTASGGLDALQGFLSPELAGHAYLAHEGKMTFITFYGEACRIQNHVVVRASRSSRIRKIIGHVDQRVMVSNPDQITSVLDRSTGSGQHRLRLLPQGGFKVTSDIPHSNAAVLVPPPLVVPPPRSVTRTLHRRYWRSPPSARPRRDRIATAAPKAHYKHTHNASRSVVPRRRMLKTALPDEKRDIPDEQRASSCALKMEHLAAELPMAGIQPSLKVLARRLKGNGQGEAAGTRVQDALVRSVLAFVSAVAVERGLKQPSFPDTVKAITPFLPPSSGSIIMSLVARVGRAQPFRWHVGQCEIWTRLLGSLMH
eukprot:gnl/Dysnectes_brevis/4167_a5497_581.p1 GENE.gnl/Dysnectes_brevis/4167_a5497_581~~gnl/Dysnectes_brevis/4167_a5497_581.p1  ORF type:complete len:364 (-),score=134.98 gnl/Dysnectes_brevis/4167_a5497_581:160-1251(-)